MTRNPKITSHEPATDGVLRVADALLTVTSTEPRFPGKTVHCPAALAAQHREVGFDVSAERSRWRFPQFGITGITPLRSHVAALLERTAAPAQRHCHPQPGQALPSVELLPTEAACLDQRRARRVLRKPQRERPIGMMTRYTPLAPTHLARTQASEPFNGGNAVDHARQNGADQTLISETLKFDCPVGEHDKTLARALSGKVAAGVFATRQTPSKEGIGTSKGMPSGARHTWPSQPLAMKKKSDRVGVVFIEEHAVRSLFQWTQITETGDSNTPAHDKLPVVCATGQPRMFQEETIHGAVVVRSMSRMDRGKFDELSRDRKRCPNRILSGSRTRTAVVMPRHVSPRHQGTTLGDGVCCRHSSELHWDTRCIDGVARTQQLGIDAFSQRNYDLDGNGDVDDAALFHSNTLSVSDRVQFKRPIDPAL